MHIGFIGLGKMGFNMVEHLLELGHQVTAFDLSTETVEAIAEKGATAANSLQHVVGDLPKPRVVWMMVPAGKAVDAVLDGLLPFLDQGDIVIDGGNSRYTDSVARAERLRAEGVRMLDIGTSGGLDGARHGACMMAGGEREAYDVVEPMLRDLCVENGYGYMGASGAGHFVKMVHNGIEYGMMQAIGEGFDLLKASGFELDNENVARVWSNGSVIRGWLMDLAGKAFAQDNELGWLGSKVADSGEGRWTVEAAIDLGVAVPIISGSLFRRFRSQSEENFSDKVVAALRHGFGGHGYEKPEAGEGKA